MELINQKLTAIR